MSIPRDSIEQFHGALIQHGPLSDRIYLMKLNDADPARLIGELDNLARTNEYTKIFAKVPEDAAGPFLDAGYECEAAIPGYFNGDESAVLLGQYFDPDRRIENNEGEYEHIIGLARAAMQPSPKQADLPPGTSLRSCSEADAPAMSVIYRTVFESYPFPIDDPAYIRTTMREDVVYFGIESGGRLVALASAEMDLSQANAEMTDFATLPDYRGNGLAVRLLVHMEQDMCARGIVTAYTIARAISPGMNITFAKCGYYFGGRLKNNTNIAGSIESMNVWHKPLE